MTATCAWCDAPKQSGLICPQCGADYAKAEAIKNKGRAESVLASSLENNSDSSVDDTSETLADLTESLIPVKDPAFEKTVCLFALPGMLSFALFVQVSGFLSGMQRIFFAMPIHELGHAVSGWLCGFNSIPTLWKTLTPENRGYFSSVLLIIGLFMLARYGLRIKKPAWLAAVLIILVVQAYGTLVISPSKADMYIVMGGDAMGLILATILMALFYVGKQTQLYKGALRWGFLGIGAAAFMNMYIPWWNKDMSAIGYGLTGGIPTDSWKMINIHLWSWDNLFNTHIILGLLCLLAIVAVYILGLKQANRWVKEQEKKERLHRLNAA
jgi:hypothetical protein